MKDATRRSLSVLLAVSLVLSMLGATGLQLVGAGTAYAAAQFGKNLVYENVYGLVQPSGSQHAYAIMYNNNACGTWSDGSNKFEGGTGYSMVRSDGTVTMRFDSNRVYYLTGNAFYRWDGLIPLYDGVFFLDGDRVATHKQKHIYQGCPLTLEELSLGSYYDENSKHLISWEGDNFVVHKRNGAVAQTIPLPSVADGAGGGGLSFSYGKNQTGISRGSGVSLSV